MIFLDDCRSLLIGLCFYSCLTRVQFPFTSHNNPAKTYVRSSHALAQNPMETTHLLTRIKFNFFFLWLWDLVSGCFSDLTTYSSGLVTPAFSLFLAVTHPWLKMLPCWVSPFCCSLCLVTLLPVMTVTPSFPSVRSLLKCPFLRKPSSDPSI